MDKYSTEIFGEFTYAESMSYEDLLASENALIEQIDVLFQDGGAAHIDFTPSGDQLLMQCAFECRNLEILRDIASEIAEVLPKGIRGRLLCLEKDLVSYHLFWIRRNEWAEKEYKFPKNMPDDAKPHPVPDSGETS